MKVNEIKWPLSEEDMMEMDMIWPETEEELLEVIRNLIKYENNDYGTSARSLTLAAEAAFNYMAHVMGSTGFQAGCAQGSFMLRMKHIKSQMRILNYDNLLYPQFLDNFRITPEQCIKENASWLKAQAKEKLKNANGWEADEVVKHWKYLATLNVSEESEEKCQ